MKTFQKTSSHIETYILECDFPHESSFLKQIEAKREFSLSLLPNTKPIYQFSEKAHTFDEYISIADSLFLKKIQTTIPPHFVTKYQQYTIQNTETIYGIALKFDVNPEILNNLNFLTEDSILFPGQVISIPTKELYQKPNSSEELAPHIEELSLLDVKDWINFEEENNEETKEEIDNNLPIEEMILLRRSSDINVDLLSFKANPTVNKNRKMSEDFKYEVYYCTSYGDIKGILTINEFQMTFDPLHSIHSDKTTSRSLDFRVCLELQDIVEAFMMNLPNKYCDDDLLYEKTKEYNKDYFLEINISRIGDEAIENKYKERIQDMKLEKLALATIFFKIYDQNYKEELKNTEKYKIANEIQKKVNGVLNLHSNGQKTEPSPAKIQFLEQSSTKIPFFDILYENLFKISQKKAHKGYKSKPTIKNLKLFGVIQEDLKDSKTLKDFEDVPEYIPKLIEDSNILTSEHFLEILDYIPPVLKLRNWKLVYSNITHGISLNTLIYKCKDIGPNILVVKDFKGWVFGAYCTDSWERGQQFYGKGETFLFSFKDGKKINSFTWSGKNHDFQFTDSDGLALGAGRSNSGYRFGLYIKGDLLSGNSYCCETFENDILSDNHDFDVKFIEIWGCDAFIDI